MTFEVEATSRLDIAGKSFPVVNRSGLTDEMVIGDPAMRQIAAQLSRWVDNARSATTRTSMFDRGAYTPPDNPYEEIRAARQAVKYDSIVSGVAEITEAFAFQGVKWEGEDADEADVFNQMSRDMNLDAVIRAMWREEFTINQFVAAKLWGWSDFTVRGKTKNGNQRKKRYRIWCPQSIRILDSAKVVPVDVGPLGSDRLCWSSTPGEIGYYEQTQAGALIDPLMLQFFTRRYEPNYEEAGELGALGVPIADLLEMNPDWVFRHTSTKSDYMRFADIRLKSIFRLLDLKQQLMQADRAALIGQANYILLVKKGSKEQPAMPEEMQNLRENFNYISRLPVIISDYRLDIEIVAPKQDFVLQAAKYDMIDSRILARLLGTLTIGATGGGRSENQETLSYAVARVMENRRHMLKRTLEFQIARAVVQHPKNAGVFDTEPNLVYMPRNVSLSMDAAYVQGLQSLRTMREISRETILEYFGLDEATEAQRMEMEAEMYDDIFKTEVPYTSTGNPGQNVDQNLDKTQDSPAIQVGPDGTLKLSGGGAGAGSANGRSQGKGRGGSQAGVGSTPVGSNTAPKARGAVKTPNGTPEAPQNSGRRGGRPTGGGSSPTSPQAIAKPRTRNGNPRTRASQEGDDTNE